MSQQIVKQPLGANGQLDIEESAGVISVDVSEQLAAVGIGIELKLDISSAVLLNSWAAKTSNAGLKAALLTAAGLIGKLP